MWRHAQEAQHALTPLTAVWTAPTVQPDPRALQQVRDWALKFLHMCCAYSHPAALQCWAELWGWEWGWQLLLGPWRAVESAELRGNTQTTQGRSFKVESDVHPRRTAKICLLYSLHMILTWGKKHLPMIVPCWSRILVTSMKPRILNQKHTPTITTK